ncbi:MAG TPA: hypothetical protein VN030_03815 [Cellvibrio sp.]|nr:hypothetical protein [Cellvibrio sp.]
MIIVNHNQDQKNSNGQPAATDDSFDIFLRTQLQQQKSYLSDENFSAGVLARLPKVKRISRWRERLIIIIPLVAISLLVLSQHSLLAFAIRSWVLLSVISFADFIKITLELSVVMLMAVGFWSARKINLF